MRKTLVLVALMTQAAYAETLYVNSPTADLKSSTTADAKVVAQLSRGSALTVVSRQGSWVQGISFGKTGWIYKFKLSATRPSGGESVLAGLSSGGATAREGSTAASIRGLSPTSEKYAGRVKIGPDQVAMVKHMESVKVSQAEVEKFLKEGKLGEFGGTP